MHSAVCLGSDIELSRRSTQGLKTVCHFTGIQEYVMPTVRTFILERRPFLRCRFGYDVTTTVMTLWYYSFQIDGQDVFHIED